jgi:hypothetical protein
LVHLGFSWYIFPVLVSCTKKNLATLMHGGKLVEVIGWMSDEASRSGFNQSSFRSQNGWSVLQPPVYLGQSVEVHRQYIHTTVSPITGTVFFSLKTTTLYTGGIRSHDPLLQSHRWHVETIPLCRPRRQGSLLKGGLDRNCEARQKMPM